jgi:lipopolysaccharide transport system permease protein
MSDPIDAAAAPAWTKVIVARRRLLEIPFREIWRYRDLVLLLAMRDLSANYKQTVLGPAWFVLQPLLATVFFSFIFGRFGHMGTDHIPHLLFYFSGLAMWNFMSDCLNKTSQVFTRNAGLFGKVYFPRFVVPLGTVLTSFLGFLVQFGFFLCFLVFYLLKGTHGVHPNWRIIFLPLFLLQLTMLGIGLGCIVSALSVRYRDLTLGIGFGVQLWMYASMVIFPLSRIAPRDRWIFLLNPVVPVIEGFRFAFLGEGVVEKWHMALSAGMCGVIFLIGVILFNRAEQNAMDLV